MERRRQKFWGCTSAIVLAIALLALFDGLVAQMRTGSNELDILPGQYLIISGPAVLKNPLHSDIIAKFTPSETPLSFELEGFFTGYWFGNGMWRGKVYAPAQAEPGRYTLRITFRGASAQTAQNYIFNVFENAEAMRESSYSLIRRYADLNPFILAAWAGGLGLATGIITYILGRRYALALVTLGLAEIYRANEIDGSIWCLAPAHLAPKPGNARMVLDEKGHMLGEARSEDWRKGKLRLTMLDGRPVPLGSLVCLIPPGVSLHKIR